MTSRPCSRSSADGITLVEVLVGMTVMLLVTGAALSLSLSSRRLYEMDQARTRLSQGVKAAKDFLTVDVRQAGERLAGDFPALEILRGEDLPGGSAGSPDELVVRRNLVSTVMNSCRDLSGGNRRIFVSERILSPPPPGCTPLPDDDADGWPDDHKIWFDYRNARGELLSGSRWVWAYIYNPQTQQGEFFKYWRDLPIFGQIVAAPGTVWTHSYPVADRPRVYLLEERRYGVTNDTLQIVINGQGAEAINLVDGVDDFQLLAHFQSSASSDSLGPADDWLDLRAIEVGLDSSIDVRGEPIEDSWSTLVMPRNVLSR